MATTTPAQDQAALDAAIAAHEAKVRKPSDYANAAPQAIASFRYLLRQRLLADKPLPTVDEVDGLAILALDVFDYTPGRPAQPYGLGQF